MELLIGMCDILTDERYSYLSNGLSIKNITEADNGVYTCRAEVYSDGRYDERRITVTVQSLCSSLL